MKTRPRLMTTNAVMNFRMTNSRKGRDRGPSPAGSRSATRLPGVRTDPNQLRAGFARQTTLCAGVGRTAVTVQPFAHFLAGLEERHTLLIDRHMGAGARIAAGPGRTMLDRERAETAQLDPIAARQGRHDLIENRVDDILDIPLIEVRVVLGDALNQFGFDHRDW